MPKRLFTLVGLVLLVLGASLPGANVARAQTGAPVTISGTVVNGTEGGGVSGLTVTLHQQGPDVHEDFETVTDDQGQFQFEDVTPIPGFGYAVSASYKDTFYGQDIERVFDGMPPVTLTVYEPTDDEAVLRADEVALLITGVDRRSQTVTVLEIVTIGNGADRTYVPGPEPMKLLRFSLPPGATGLQVQTELLNADVLQVDKGFGLTSAVPPGEHQVWFAYRFPYTGSAVTLTKSLPYGAQQIRVLLPQGSIQVDSPDLRGPETIEVGGTPYRLMAGSELPRGGEVTFGVSGLPQPTFMERIARTLAAVPWQLAAPMAVGLLAAGLVTYALLRRRRREDGEEVSGDVPGTEREALVESLAVLTEQFDAGEMDEATYHSQRQQMMRKLAVLQRKPSSSEGKKVSSEQRPEDFLYGDEKTLSITREEDIR